MTGNDLKKLRLTAGITRENLGNDLNISYGLIIQMEQKGDMPISWTIEPRVSAYFKLKEKENHDE